MSYLLRLFNRPPKAQAGMWQVRHMAALADSGMFSGNEHERAMVNLIRSWLSYADAHQERYETGIGDDGFLGPYWAKIGMSLRELLNGELGRLDAGTLDGVLHSVLEDEGFDPNNPIEEPQ